MRLHRLLRLSPLAMYRANSSAKLAPLKISQQPNTPRDEKYDANEEND
jgi:hypothetical protein